MRTRLSRVAIVDVPDEDQMLTGEDLLQERVPVASPSLEFHGGIQRRVDRTREPLLYRHEPREQLFQREIVASTPDGPPLPARSLFALPRLEQRPQRFR